MSTAKVLSLLVAFAICGGNVVHADCSIQDSKACTYSCDGNYYDLSTLAKAPGAPPYRVFDNDKIYAYNVCENAVQCGSQTNSVACYMPSNPAGAKAEGTKMVGTLKPDASHEITPMDIADVNWKTQHVPPFKPDTKGVLLHYPAYGQMQYAGGAPGDVAGGPPTNPYGNSAQGAYSPAGQQPNNQYPPPAGAPPPPPPSGWAPPPPSWPSPPAAGATYPPPPPYAWPPPPPPGRRLLEWPNQGPVIKGSEKSVTIGYICDPTLEEPRPLQFARGQTYFARDGGYLFFIAAKEACGGGGFGSDVLGTGLSWGWFFLICISVALFLYLSIGIFYNFKKLGVTGIEAIPNVDFWRDVPGLTKDGIAFSITTIKACVARGAAKGGAGGGTGGSYSTV